MKNTFVFGIVMLAALNAPAKAQAVFADSDYTCTTQKVGIFTNTDCTNGFHSEAQVIGIFTYTDGINARGKKFRCEAQKVGITVETSCHVTDQ